MFDMLFYLFPSFYILSPFPPLKKNPSFTSFPLKLFLTKNSNNVVSMRELKDKDVKKSQKNKNLFTKGNKFKLLNLIFYELVISNKRNY